MDLTYLVEQRLNLFLLLPLTDLVRVCDSEELWRDIDKPLRFDSSHVVTVLAGREDELVVDDPLWVPIEERRRRMDVDGSPFD